MSRPLRAVTHVFVILVACVASMISTQVAGAVPATIPNPSATWNELKGVDALSKSDVWAVGDYLNDTAGAYQTLVIHWNGTAWSQKTSPNPSSTDSELAGVSALSST